MGQFRDPNTCSSHWESWRFGAWSMHDTAEPPNRFDPMEIGLTILPVWQVKGCLSVSGRHIQALCP